MTSPSHATQDNQANLAATIVDVNHFDTSPSTPASPTSRACCGIAQGLRAPLFIGALGLAALATGLLNATMRYQHAETSTDHALFSAGSGFGLVGGVFAMGLAAVLAKEHFASTTATHTLQDTPPPATPRPQSSYLVVSQPNQEIALAVQTGSPQGREIP